MRSYKWVFCLFTSIWIGAYIGKKWKLKAYFDWTPTPKREYYIYRGQIVFFLYDESLTISINTHVDLITNPSIPSLPTAFCWPIPLLLVICSSVFSCLLGCSSDSLLLFGIPSVSIGCCSRLENGQRFHLSFCRFVFFLFFFRWKFSKNVAFWSCEIGAFASPSMGDCKRAKKRVAFLNLEYVLLHSDSSLFLMIEKVWFDLEY